MDLGKFITSKLDKFRHDVADNVVNTANNANYGLWHSPVGQGLVNLQKSTPAFQQGGINAFGLNNFLSNGKSVTDYVPQFQAPKNTNLLQQGAATIGNLPLNIASTVVGKGFVDPALDVGRLATANLQGKVSPGYNQIKSAPVRLGYNLQGINTTPQQLIGNIAGAAEPILNAYGGNEAPSLAKNAVGQGVKQGFLKTVGSTAASSAKVGGLFGVLQGLAEGRSGTLQNQLLQGAQQGAAGAVVGGVTGGAIGAVGYGLGALQSKLTKLLVKDHGMTEAEAAQAVKQFARNEVGQFTGKKRTAAQLKSDTLGFVRERTGKVAGEPVYYSDLRKALSLPEDGNYQRGSIDFNAKIGGNSPIDDIAQKVRKGGINSLTKEEKATLYQLPVERAREILNQKPEGFFHNLETKMQEQGVLPTNMQEAQKGFIDFNAPVGSQKAQGGQKAAAEVRDVLTGKSMKERGFVTSVKEGKNTPEALKKLVSGSYVIKSNKQLKVDALKLIHADPATAEKLALNPTADVHVQIGNELINSYAGKGNFTKAQQIAEGMAQSGTDFGRAVQAFSQYDKTSPEGAIKFAQSKVNEYNRLNPSKKLTLNDSQVKGLFDRAKKIQTMPEGRERNIAANALMNEVNDFIPSSVVDKAITIWKAGLLTSLRTHERNLFGNTIHGVAETVKDIPASAADQVMALRTGKRSLTFTTKGTAEGTVKGLRAAKDIVALGYDPEEAISKYDVRHVTWGGNPIEQTLKKYTNAVFRTLGAEDKPFWNASFARSLYDQAGAEAINAGKQGNTAYVKNLVANPTENMLVTATKDANIATFHDQNSFSKVANAVKQQLSKNELTKLGAEVIAPFTGVPSSIGGQIVAYSPIGLIKGVARVGNVVANDIPALQRQAAQEVGRGTLGTALLGIGAYLTQKGLMTGQPKDTNEAAQWQLENKPANSVFINGKWRSINSIGPESLVVLAGAKAQEELQKGKDASLGEYGAGLGKDFLGQTFLQGVQQPLAAVNDPVRYGQSYVGNQASSVIPNIVKDASKALDPYARESNSVGDYLTNALPVLRNKNVVKRDNLGNPIAQEPTGVGAFFDLFNSKTPVSNPVVDELARLNNAGANATPSKLQKSQTINGVKMKLTPEQLDVLEGQAGPQVTQALQTFIQSPEYQSLADEDKGRAIDSLVSQVRKEVRGSIDLTGQQTVTSPTPTTGQYTVVTDSGTVKRIDLATPVAQPNITGNSELDKQLLSKYRSQINSRINDVTLLFTKGQISAEDANSQIIALRQQYTKTSGPKKLKVGKIKLGTVKIAKAKKVKVKKLKAKIIKLSNR